MAFGNLGGGQNSAPMAEINVIPLVDIMLVLLVIFIITAPLLTNAVKIDLPKATSQPHKTQPGSVTIAIDARGNFYWNGQPVDRTTLSRRLIAAGKRTPEPALHLRAHHATPYGVLVKIMAEAGEAGLGKIAFVSDPSAGAAPGTSNQSGDPAAPARPDQSGAAAAR